jgi:hypothetical protein
MAYLHLPRVGISTSLLLWRRRRYVCKVGRKAETDLAAIEKKHAVPSAFCNMRRV